MPEKQLKGIIPAVIIPLTQNRKIDGQLYARQIQYLVDSGVDGLFINGTTGEGPCLSREERLESFRIVKDVAGGKQLLCAASIHPATEQVIAEINALKFLNPDFVVAVPPFYYAVTQKAIIDHYKAIAEASPFPVIAYNIPQRTHNKIEYETLIKIAFIDNIVAIKDSSGDFITFSRWLQAGLPEDFSLVQGEDYLDGPSLTLGAGGIVSGLCNVWADPYRKMMEAKEAHDLVKINALQGEINRLYGIIEVTGGKVLAAIKAGAAVMGRSTKRMKMEGQELDLDEIKKVEKVIEELDLPER